MRLSYCRNTGYWLCRIAIVVGCCYKLCMLPNVFVDTVSWDRMSLMLHAS